MHPEHRLRKPRADYNFRAEPEYYKVREEIWELLEQQIRKTSEALSHTEAVPV